MSPRSRMRAILAEAGLAPQLLERERLRGQQQAQQAQTWSDALTRLADTGVSAGFKGLDVMKSDAAEEANTAAKKIVAENAGLVGDELAGPTQTGDPLYAKGAGDLAKEKAGPLEQIEGGDFFGFKKRAASKATADAEAQLAAGVTANREKAKTDRLAATKRARDEADRDLRNKATQQSIDIAGAGEKRSADAAARTAMQQKAAAAAAEAVAKGTSLGQFVVDHVDSGIDDGVLAAAFAKARADADAAALEAQGKRADIGLKNAEANAKYAAAAAAGGATSKGAKDRREDMDAMRREFDTLPQTKDFNNASVAYDKMKASAAQKTPAGDIALIYAFNKVQDPNSTVRESEFRSAAMAGDFGDKIANLVKQHATGQRLTDSQRADLLQQAANFLAAHKTAYDAQVGRYSDIVKRRGGDLADVIPGAGSATEEVPPWRR